MRTTLFAAVIAVSLSPLSAQTLGTATPSGLGCIASGNQIYELFQPGTFDLDNLSLIHISEPTRPY